MGPVTAFADSREVGSNQLGAARIWRECNLISLFVCKRTCLGFSGAESLDGTNSANDCSVISMHSVCTSAVGGPQV